MDEQKSAAEVKSILLKFGLHVEGTFRADGPMFIEEPVSVGFRCQVVNSSIGAFTYLVGDNYLKTTVMGRYCSVAVGAAIAPDEHPTDGLTTSNFPYAKSRVSFYDDYVPTETWAVRTKTLVGHDVWIGRGALIKSGVEIGSGAVIGAGAVVTRSVEPYAIVGGLPARLIRKRFSEPMIERLLKVRWWDYDIRGWLTRNPDVKTIPLTESTLSRIEDAIAAEELRPLRSVRHQIDMADGTCIVKTLPP